MFAPIHDVDQCSRRTRRFYSGGLIQLNDVDECSRRTRECSDGSTNSGVDWIPMLGWCLCSCWCRGSVRYEAESESVYPLSAYPILVSNLAVRMVSP